MIKGFYILSVFIIFLINSCSLNRNMKVYGVPWDRHTFRPLPIEGFIEKDRYLCTIKINTDSLIQEIKKLPLSTDTLINVRVAFQFHSEEVYFSKNGLLHYKGLSYQNGDRLLNCN